MEKKLIEPLGFAKRLSFYLNLAKNSLVDHTSFLSQIL